MQKHSDKKDKKKEENIKESYASMFGEITKHMKSSHQIQAAKELADEYDIGKVLYVFRTNRRAFDKSVKDKMKEMKQFRSAKKLKEGGMGILSTDQADVLQGLVMKHKSKNTRALLNIVLKNKRKR
jgi:hypothetical protein